MEERSHVVRANMLLSHLRRDASYRHRKRNTPVEPSKALGKRRLESPVGDPLSRTENVIKKVRTTFRTLTNLIFSFSCSLSYSFSYQKNFYLLAIAHQVNLYSCILSAAANLVTKVVCLESAQSETP